MFLAIAIVTTLMTRLWQL